MATMNVAGLFGPGKEVAAVTAQEVEAAVCDHKSHLRGMAPLRIILKSPQPYRGLGEQVRQQIEKRIEQLDDLLNTPYSEFWSLD